MTTNNADWLLKESDYITLKQNWEIQLQQYQRQNELINGRRHFDHDLKYTITTIASLIDRGQNEVAKNLLKEVSYHIEKREELTKQHSNNALLDTLLFNYQGACDGHAISFHADCYFPHDQIMHDADVCRVFNNLFNNAFEACIKVEQKEKRFIQFHSRTHNQWLIIVVKNSYVGEVVKEHHHLQTTKKDRNHHGLGIQNIETIIEKYDGMTEFNADSILHNFTFTIYLPVNE